MTTERDIYGFGTSAEREVSRRYARQFRDRRPSRERDRPTLTDPSLVETGFFGAQPGASFTGQPQTVAVQDFVTRFINQYGARPNSYDVAAFQRTLPDPYELNESRVYTPESLQAQMGFRTGADLLRAQREGLTYGPFAGENVPFGGLVTYDPQTGQPLNRYFDLKGEGFARRDIGAGRFIPPPGGLGVTQQNVFGELPESQFYQDYTQGARPGPGEFYPRAGQVTFQAPTLQQAEEQGLITTDPIDLYGAKLYDYLTSQQFPQRGAGGEIFVEAMTIEEANQIIDDVEKQIQRGVPVEQLPFFSESQGTEGEEVSNLRNRVYGDVVTGLREEWEQRRVGFGSPVRQVGSDFGPGADARGRVTEGVQPTGTERGEYLQWVRGLDLSFNPTQWLEDQFRDYYDIWLASGSGSFVGWVGNYISPLEEFEQVPQFGERIQAPRARTLRR